MGILYRELEKWWTYNMRRKLVSLGLMLADAGVVALIPYLTLLLRFDGSIDGHYLGHYWSILTVYIPIIVLTRILVFHGFGLYQRLWRYASIHELVAITGAVTTSSIAIYWYMLYTGSNLPRTVHFLSWFLTIACIGTSRLCVRFLWLLRRKTEMGQVKVLIVGAGDAGAMIAREINQRCYDKRIIVGFIDDDLNKQNQMLFGTKVVGTRHDIKRIVQELGVNEIIIAIPSAGRTALREIIWECKQTGCEMKIVPGIYELINGQVTMQQLRTVEVEDLLGRATIELDLPRISQCLTNKRIVVTGAGGSIGSELCRQIAKMSPDLLVLLGKGENSIYEIHRELKEKYPDVAIEPVIADVKDVMRIEHVFAHYKPQVIFHAAAHKHVPLMEKQPDEAVRNNIFGTRNVAEAADRVKAEAFILISTDKAVNPTSVMGATKRVAELIVQDMSRISRTKFAAVRFGNVLGSRGSVIPLFKQQIAQGGPITITHPDMERYFMTIPEATQLVLQAGAMAEGGEVFVLDMGEPVKIVDMARDLINLSGLEPDQDIQIVFTGLRPGEKLFEELLTAEEGTTSTRHQKIHVANIRAIDKQKLSNGLAALKNVTNEEQIIEVLSMLVPTYTSDKLKQRRLNTRTVLGGNDESELLLKQVAGNVN